jgi:hypothetical protein
MLQGTQGNLGLYFPKALQEMIKENALDWSVPLNTLMREIETLYFSDSPMISSFEDQVAFILLSYAHILLFLCQHKKLNISTLEILCKDCIDRGVVVNTLLKLHFLHITGKLTSDNLKNVLIHTVMPAWIVKKQPIIKSRRNFIDYTCKRMAKAASIPTAEWLASSLVQLPPENSSYLPATSPSFQSVFPECSAATSNEMYADYLNHSLEIVLPLYNGNILDTTADKTRKANIGIYQTTVIENVNKLSYLISFKKRPLSQPYYQNLQKLLVANQISVPDITKIACLIQSPIFDETAKLLEQMFNNPKLGFTIAHCNTQPPTVELSVISGDVSIQFTTTFNLSQNGIKQQTLQAKIVVDSHIKDNAYLVLSKVGT